MRMRDNKELKPCPFCDSHDLLAKGFKIMCLKCSCTVAGVQGSRELAEAWNTRHVPKGYKLVPVSPTKDLRKIADDIAKNLMMFPFTPEENTDGELFYKLLERSFSKVIHNTLKGAPSALVAQDKQTKKLVRQNQPKTRNKRKKAYEKHCTL